MLGSEADQPVLVRHQVHRRRSDERGDEGVHWVVVHRRRGTELAYLATAQHGDPLTQPHRLHLVVGDVDRGRPDPLVELLQLVAGRRTQLGVEVGQRLVEEEHLRLAYQGAGERHPLPLTARQLSRPPAEQVIDAEQLGGPPHPALPFGLIQALGLEREGDVGGHRLVWVERIALEHHRDLASPRRQPVDDVAHRSAPPHWSAARGRRSSATGSSCRNPTARPGRGTHPRRWPGRCRRWHAPDHRHIP